MLFKLERAEDIRIQITRFTRDGGRSERQALRAALQCTEEGKRVTSLQLRRPLHARLMCSTLIGWPAQLADEGTEPEPQAGASETRDWTLDPIVNSHCARKHGLRCKRIAPSPATRHCKSRKDVGQDLGMALISQLVPSERSTPAHGHSISVAPRLPDRYSNEHATSYIFVLRVITYLLRVSTGPQRSGSAVHLARPSIPSIAFRRKETDITSLGSAFCLPKQSLVILAPNGRDCPRITHRRHYAPYPLRLKRAQGLQPLDTLQTITNLLCNSSYPRTLPSSPKAPSPWAG